MPKYTVLEMSQRILSSMDSDEVTSITDTVESQQVGTILETCYYDLVARANLPEDYLPFNLTETSATTPNQMSLPTDFSNLQCVKYDCQTLTQTDPLWTDIDYLSWKDFSRMMYSLNESDTNVDTYNITVGSSTIPIIFTNDLAPKYYSSFDDRTVIFDSYDSAVDTFLRSIKSQAEGRKLRTWTMSDSFVPDLDEDQFQLLLQEAKSLAWAELKQTPHQKAEQSARRLRITQQKSKTAIRGFKDLDKFMNFGRK